MEEVRSFVSRQDTDHGAHGMSYKNDIVQVKLSAEFKLSADF